MKKPAAKILRAGAMLAGIAGVASLVFYFWLGFGSNAYEKLPFEKEEWLHGTSKNQQNFPRLEMADDLMAKKTLYGMGKKEILAMLGEPDQKDVQWGEKDQFGLLYWLGPERGLMSVDSEWLGITFDKKGKVSQYKLVRD
jgi:hypothetical protein